MPAGPRCAPETDSLLARLAGLPAGHPHRGRLRTRVIELNLPYARRLAAQYCRSGEPADDLNQVAALALTLAVDRYDPARGVTFHTFATPTILGELRRHLRDTGWGVHVPRPLQELALQLKDAEVDVTGLLGHTATPADLATALHITEQQALAGLRVTQTGAYRPMSLDRPAADDPLSPTLIDMLGQPDPAIGRAETTVTVRALLAQLPEREQSILAMRYYRGMTQASIASRVGVSQMHVSRLINRSLARLHDIMAKEHLCAAPWSSDAADVLPRRCRKPPRCAGPEPRAPGGAAMAAPGVGGPAAAQAADPRI